MKNWKPEEIDTMRRLYGKVPNKELAKMLSRSFMSVSRKASEMGIINRRMAAHIKEARQEDKIVKIRGLGKTEKIPSMPCCLLWHLIEMDGCMTSKVVEPNAGRRAYLERMEQVRPQISEMLKHGITAYKIARKLGMANSTVYGYVEEMRI